MPTVRGKDKVRSYMASAPAKLETVLRGAARAGGKVFETYIEENTPSETVRQALRTRTKVDGEKISARTDLRSRWARTIANWLEYGTSAHFISVDDSVRRGMSVGRINQRASEGSLVINGHFVGTTVWHPGTSPHPVFRPACDLKEAEAIAAAQAYIDAHATRAGIAGGDEVDE